MPDLHAELARIVLGTPWLVEVLQAVRDVGPPDAYVGAGAIRNVVWDALHGHHTAQRSNDVDVVYFARGERSPSGWALQLRRALPSCQWDVTNQAHVHDWQSQQLDRPVSPYQSLHDAIASWPETATAIAVRLRPPDRLALIAPFGLADLFDLQVRPNAGLLDRTAFSDRCHSKQWTARWPRLAVCTAPRGQQ